MYIAYRKTTTRLTHTNIANLIFNTKHRERALLVFDVRREQCVNSAAAAAALACASFLSIWMVVLLSSSTSLFVGVVKLLFLYYRGNLELVTTYRITEKKKEREKRDYLAGIRSAARQLPPPSDSIEGEREHTDALTTNVERYNISH